METSGVDGVLMLNGNLIFQDDSRWVSRLLVDTGAGLCFLIPDEEMYSKLPLARGQPVKVRVADGRELILHDRVNCTVSLMNYLGKQAVQRHLELLVFPPLREGTGLVILGRHGVREFRL